jgi:hypothetical protein
MAIARKLPILFRSTRHNGSFQIREPRPESIWAGFGSSLLGTIGGNKIEGCRNVSPRYKFLLPPPALCERSHGGLARCRVPMVRRAIPVIAEGQGPHPRAPYGRGVHLEDAADNFRRWRARRNRHHSMRQMGENPRRVSG